MASNETIAAVVVTYQPKEEVVQNLCRLSEQVRDIFVVDNGSGDQSRKVLEEIEAMPGIRLLRNPGNLGIASALNRGIRAALQTEAAWIATFDQDSSVTDHYFQRLLKVYKLCPRSSLVGMVVPMGWSARVTRILQYFTPVWSFVLTANTSGCLIRRDVFAKAGFHDEDLFIDFVDIEFCLKLKQHGCRILKAMEVSLNHELGSPRTRTVSGVTVAFRDHTPWRYYYMTRNRFLLYRRYWRVSLLWIAADVFWFFYGSAQLCLEPQRRQKLAAIREGFKDALRGWSGRHPLYPPQSGSS